MFENESTPMSPNLKSSLVVSVIITLPSAVICKKPLPSLYVSDKALDLIAQVGFDPVYGARPLKRAIQQSVENPLAKAILAGKVIPDKPVKLLVSNDQIIAHQ